MDLRARIHFEKSWLRRGATQGRCPGSLSAPQQTVAPAAEHRNGLGCWRQRRTIHQAGARFISEGVDSGIRTKSTPNTISTRSPSVGNWSCLPDCLRSGSGHDAFASDEIFTGEFAPAADFIKNTGFSGGGNRRNERSEGRPPRFCRKRPPLGAQTVFAKDRCSGI